MFERFTAAARAVVVLAQEEARGLRHDYIGTEHLLLGLLREGHGLAAMALADLGVTLDEVRDRVTEIVGSGDHVTQGQIPFTPRAKKVLEIALREARGTEDEHIDTEHLLLGLVRENEGVGVRILLDLGVDPDSIRRRLGLRRARPVRHRSVQRPSASVRGDGPRQLPLDWSRATMLWRPEGLELRVPLVLSEGAMAAFAADEVWAREPLDGMRREIWNGWLSLASPTLLEAADPVELRRVLDDAAKRASDVSGRERGRVEDFLDRLREGR